jgi:hypothetical protein
LNDTAAAFAALGSSTAFAFEWQSNYPLCYPSRIKLTWGFIYLFSCQERPIVVAERSRASYFIAHWIHATAMIAIRIDPEATKTASFCQKSRPPARNARYRTMNANQPKKAITVAATLPLRWVSMADSCSYILYNFRASKKRKKRGSSAFSEQLNSIDFCLNQSPNQRLN